jgi:hypothetical protein
LYSAHFYASFFLTVSIEPVFIGKNSFRELRPGPEVLSAKQRPGNMGINFWQIN